jgi:hypothetical protein
MVVIGLNFLLLEKLMRQLHYSIAMGKRRPKAKFCWGGSGGEGKGRPNEVNLVCGRNAAILVIALIVITGICTAKLTIEEAAYLRGVCDGLRLGAMNQLGGTDASAAYTYGQDVQKFDDMIDRMLDPKDASHFHVYDIFRHNMAPGFITLPLWNGINSTNNSVCIGSMSPGEVRCY